MTDLSHHHAEQIVQAHRRLDGQDARIAKLEIHAAGETVRSHNIERSLTEIQDGIKWITRIVIGGMAAAIVAYMMKGGFNVGP